MSTRDAFLSEIIANPDDDVSRLVFADWLEDHGDADRAEFIRAQIRLEGMPEWDPDRFDLEERSLDLLSAHWDEWTAGLPPAALREKLTFRRGFIGEAVMRPDRFLACGDELVAAAPLLRLTLRGLGQRPEDLARSPALLGLRGVGIEFSPGWNDPEELDTAPFFREWRPYRLRHLDLGVFVHPRESVRYPLDWPGYQGLESLGLRTLDATDGEVAAFFARPGWGELRRLAIDGYKVGEQSVVAACRHDGISELDLLVSGTPRAAQAITSNGWKQLACLRLCGLQAQEDELRAMTVAPWFSRLRSLVVNGTPFNAHAALSAAPAGLQHLYLVRTPVDGDGLGGLLDSELVAGLTSLALYDSLPAQALHNLATSPRLSGLRSLSASPRTDNYADLSAGRICDMIESPHLAGLTHLSLVCGEFGPADVERFAGLSGLARLRSLHLSGCRLDASGVRALARSPHLAGLRRLNIDAEGGGPCLPALLEAPWLASLRELRFSCEGIDDDDLKALAANPAVSRLRVLHLGPQPITRAGTEALANSPHLGGLLSLNVSSHRDDDDLEEPLRDRFGGRY
jgi:uncharacterized protein (TIGR02996 family)